MTQTQRQTRIRRRGARAVTAVATTMEVKLAIRGRALACAPLKTPTHRPRADDACPRGPLRTDLSSHGSTLPTRRAAMARSANKPAAKPRSSKGKAAPRARAADADDSGADAFEAPSDDAVRRQAPTIAG